MSPTDRCSCSGTPTTSSSSSSPRRGRRAARLRWASPRETRLTERLRLEPVRPEHADDLYRLHQDPAVAEWWDGVGTEESARADAMHFASGWVEDGVSKWMAYDRVTGELVGRGGLSRMELDGAS